MSPSGENALDDLASRIRACRICRDNPTGRMLPHEPRPVLVVSRKAPILIAGQAPGTRVHASGRPFSDPSGARLREWMGVREDQFYNPDIFAIAPMGMCFPGLDRHGGDLPPRRECAPQWRMALMAHMPQIRLIIAVGRHAHAWHLGPLAGNCVTEAVRNWRECMSLATPVFPLPHPSWRNSGWVNRNQWFKEELLPVLKHALEMHV